METADVVIVGSGYGGAIPALRLAEAGMKVVVLERGVRREAADLRQSDDPVWIQEVVDLVVASNNVAFRTGKLMGGASINMDGAFFRMPQASFEVTDASGRRYWPGWASREALDPYYETVEAMLKVRQLTWEEIPKTGGLFAKMLDRAGASCDLARLNYTDCLQCGFCSVGCIYDKKMTLLHTYIPAAEAAGAEFRAGAAVDHVAPAGGTSVGYVVRYRHDGEDKEIEAPRVFVAGGGIHTPALLLRSRPYLEGLTSHVGEHFNNNGEHGFVGVVSEGFDDLDAHWCFKGMENAGLMSFHWFEEEGFTLHPGGGLEPTILAGNFRADDSANLPRRSWGLEYKRFAESVYPRRLVAFSALGLADGHAAITIKSDGSPDIVPRDSAAAEAYLDRLEAIVFQVGQDTGVELFPSVPRELAGTTSAHLLSACRMSESPADGVVDPDGQVWGHENLYVCDASAVPYALAVNPALTIGALAERTAARVIAKG